jgi:hypothetical protein
MQLFRMKYGDDRPHMALVSLYPQGQLQESDFHNATHCYLGAAAYAQGHYRMEYQGLSLEGTVPIAELVRWALQRGFIAWKEAEEYADHKARAKAPLLTDAE